MPGKSELKEFRELLKRAIGNYQTQTEFGKKAGLSAAQMSKMMGTAEIGVPTVGTLQKIASVAENGVSFKDLLGSCGYEVSIADKIKEEENNKVLAARRKMPPVERVLKCIGDYDDGFKDMCQPAPYICRSIYEYVSNVDLLYGIEDVSFTVSEPQEISQDIRFPAAEEAAEVTFRLKDQSFNANFAFAILLSRTRRGSFLVFGAVSDMPTLLRLNSRLAREADESAFPETRLQDSPVYIIEYKDGKTGSAQGDAFIRRLEQIAKEERVSIGTALSMMLGTNTPKYLRSTDGIGFYVDEVPEYRITAFLQSHRDAFLRSSEDEEILREIENGTPVEEAFRKLRKIPESWHVAWGDAVEKIIRRETGLSVEFWIDRGDDDIPFDNRPCIIFPEMMPWEYNGGEKRMTKEEIMTALDQYALELQCEVTEHCQHWFKEQLD